MTAITWDDVGSRAFEAGVDRGVLYCQDGCGFAWNGIVSVAVADNTKVEPIHFDGVKFSDIITPADFSATLSAYTYPDEFLPFEGILEDEAGVYVHNQEPERFGLSYRTKVGNDVEGIHEGYKIHLLYNLTAKPNTVKYKTLGLDVDPIEFQWKISAIPENIEGFRPTAHITLDSRRMNAEQLADIEEILYGNETTAPQLPSLQALTTFIRKWERFIVRNNGDGTWSAIARDEGVVVEIIPDDTYEITVDTIVSIDADSYTITSSNKDDEDIT